MGNRPVAKVRALRFVMQLMTWLLVILLCMAPIASMDVSRSLTVTGEENEEIWNVTVSQSNDSWPILLEYENLPVWYQNNFLRSKFSPDTPDFVNLTAKKSSISISTSDGVFNVSESREIREWSWDGWGDAEEIQKERISSTSVFLKPKELDENFKLIVTIQVRNETGAWVYNEIHSFWIIGEPELVMKDPPHEGVDFIRTYLFSLFCGIGIAMYLFSDRSHTGGRS